ncbi:hypothetical protein LTR08_001483 [Meristemomyces frigidus]|nr:hypothetical protein LTR08_001483 [Meristemomyces frigidus]
MDAKPQRPRALRVHDENMYPPAIANGAAPGKTLHQRNKSMSAFPKAASKKVLGEVNANVKLIKDDMEVGKASPGKMPLHEPVKLVASFTRPATRPLASKPLSSQNMPTTSSNTTQSATSVVQSIASTVQQEPAKKVTAKKSTKVLREVQPCVQPEADNKNQGLTAPVHQTLAALQQVAPAVIKPLTAVNGVAIQHQEVHKTESVPLRDEPIARPVTKPAVVSINHNQNVPPGFTSEQDYMNFIALQNAHHNIHPQPAAYGGLPVNGHAQYALPDQQPLEQFYDVDEEEYYCEDGYTTGGMTMILAPKCTDKALKELEAAKVYVEATRSPDDIEDEQWDTSMVAEYGDEIFGYMRELENRMSPNPRYMDQQQEIQWTMRAVLMDWVIQVHQRFNLLPETLFLTVNYIDRFLSCKVVSLGKLQLVGATAIFVAAKYEEVQCPTISEIIFMVDGGYTADELLKAERFMLSMLQFELGWPGPMSFLRRISKADDYDLETRTLAKYFLEVTIMDERFVGCTPSFLAAGAHCMARLMLRKGEWSQSHVFYSDYTYSQLRQLLTGILDCCEDPKKHHAAVFDKYLDKRYKRASTFVASEMQKGFSLPGVAHVSPAPFDAHCSRLW